jgi:hypothetical protein
MKGLGIPFLASCSALTFILKYMYDMEQEINALKNMIAQQDIMLKQNLEQIFFI